MGVSLGSLRAGGKQLAQNVDTTGPYGVNLLVTDPSDYTACVRQALMIHGRHRQNIRVVDVTIVSSGIKLTLKGSGSPAELSGLDAFAKSSGIRNIWYPFDDSQQGIEPNDPNNYRVLDGPNGSRVLELLDQSFTAGETLRIAFDRVHSATEAPAEVAAPTEAPTVAMASTAAAGNVNDGAHSWVYVYRTAHGRTTASPEASLTVADKTVNGKVTITVPASGEYGIIACDVYRTVAGDTGTRKFVGTVESDGGILTDNVADESLGSDVPSTNTAGGDVTVDDDDEEALKALTASLVLQMAANKMAQNTGNTQLPNDQVDRRNQSDVFRSRSKDLRAIYDSAMGAGKDTEVSAASAFGDMDTSFSDGRRLLWHGGSRQ